MIGEEAEPQITRSDVIKIFSQREAFYEQKYLRMENEKPETGLACNMGFAKEKGLEPKIKKISKIVLVERRGEQTGLVQTYKRRGSGGRLGRFFKSFFLKKIAFLIPFGSHFARF